MLLFSALVDKQKMVDLCQSIPSVPEALFILHMNPKDTKIGEFWDTLCTCMHT